MGQVAATNFEEWDNPFEKMVLDEGYCFLCGGALRNAETEEHIYPKWLLRRPPSLRWNPRRPGAAPRRPPALNCSGYDDNNHNHYNNYLIVHETDPRYRGNPEWSIWGTWKYHVLTISGFGNLVRPVNHVN